ncbi:MAG: hypothetical protein R3A45_07440 [Bdellovibrionota bacterium]
MRIHRHIVSRQVTRSSAQSSVELALLIPIFIFIMVVFVKIYDTNLSIQ